LAASKSWSIYDSPPVPT